MRLREWCITDGMFFLGRNFASGLLCRPKPRTPKIIPKPQVFSSPAGDALEHCVLCSLAITVNQTSNKHSFCQRSPLLLVLRTNYIAPTHSHTYDKYALKLAHCVLISLSVIFNKPMNHRNSNTDYTVGDFIFRLNLS